MSTLRHIIWLLALCIGSATAHPNTVLSLKGGVLHGLPDEFQPAKFDQSRGILTISGKELKFPGSLMALFPSGEIRYELEFSSSWYHGPSFLPPYIEIKIAPRERDFYYVILVDIDSLVFLEAVVVLTLSERKTEGRSKFTKQSVPLLIGELSSAEGEPAELKEIIGKWRSKLFFVEITANTIKTSGIVDYPNGEITAQEPGTISLELPDGTKEIIHCERKGDVLLLNYLLGGGWCYLARVGSEADKAAMRRSAEQDVEPDS